MLKEVKEEDTQLLRALYDRPEEEGLQKFDESLTRQLEEYQSKVADSLQIRQDTQQSSQEG